LFRQKKSMPIRLASIVWLKMTSYSQVRMNTLYRTQASAQQNRLDK
jgi:hypothetical protein